MSDIKGVNYMFFSRSIYNQLICVLFCAVGIACAESDPELLERTLGDHAALQSAERDYQRRQSRGQLSAAERTDYEAYLGRLRDQFYRDCVQLAQTDYTVLPPDVPCPSRVPATPATAAIDQKTERTPGEQTAVLDSELDSALGEFDEMLLREQERVKAATPPTETAMSGGGGGQASGADRGGDAGAEAGGTSQAGVGPARWETETGEDGSGKMAGAKGQAGSITGPAGSGTGGDGAMVGQGAAGGKQQTVAQGQPPDIPDGSDDDVVARQLREAAEKETDPELRKKLWEEYRKYKEGTR